MKPIAIASDHAGIVLKAELQKLLDERGIVFEDLGTHTTNSCDYPDYAHLVARGILDGRFELGILVCGSGVGMSIAANRHVGIRAVVCSETFSARAARTHNDANILCLGERVVGPGTARDIVNAFLDAKFEGGRHERRVEKIEIQPR